MKKRNLWHALMAALLCVALLCPTLALAEDEGLEINAMSGDDLGLDVASGDGLDSNGDIVLNGGEVYVSSSEMDMESALDMNGDMFVNGGTLVAAGMQGMAEPLSDESGQPVVTVYYDAVQAAGTELTLSGADGSELASWTVPKQYSMVQVSASGLTTGESCTVTSGSDEKTIEVTAVNTYEGTASRGFGRGFGHGDSPRGQTQTQ
jgi:hypothetical protein